MTNPDDLSSLKIQESKFDQNFKIKKKVYCWNWNYLNSFCFINLYSISTTTSFLNFFPVT